jgi:6-phosphogluconolactonase/glucosamine-6-phosphate isomerase/deaminase
LISGGSNINAATQIMQRVPEDVSDKLIISLIDERYGEVGHLDSNFQQLLTAGFEPKRAKLVPVLQKNLDITETADRFEEFLADTINNVDLTIGLLGVGPDCHIAGILPNSNAAVENERLVSAYESSPYKRITTTFQLLRKIDICYAFAFGDNKNQALHDATNESGSLIEKPAKILNNLKEAYLYTDQVGDNQNVS